MRCSACTSAPDEAPHGLDYTGDTVFNRMWTMLHLPTLTLPSIRGANQLPVGVQLIGAYGTDDDLIEYAVSLEKMLTALEFRIFVGKLLKFS